MAGDWIPMRLDLADDPAVVSVGSKTGLDEFAVIGRLHKLWSWANRHLSDGRASGITAEWIDKFVRCRGFSEALEHCGWLLTDPSGILFPKYDEWNSNNAKHRLKATKRQQKKRIESVTPVTQMSRSDRDKSVTTGEESREEKSNHTPNPLSEAGKGGNLFDSFWTAFPNKRSRGEAEKEFAELDPDPEMVAVWIAAAIKQTDWPIQKQPHLWLRKKCWLDEKPTNGKKPPLTNKQIEDASHGRF